MLARLLAIFCLLVLTTCAKPTVNGPLVRLHLMNLPDAVTQVTVEIKATTADDKLVSRTTTFHGGDDPLNLLSVEFPAGTLGDVFFNLRASSDSSCVLGIGNGLQTLDSDRDYDVQIAISAPLLPCGAPAAKLIVQIVKSIDAAGSVTSMPDGISCGNKCEKVFPVGTEVKLHATPTNGTFRSWAGGCADTTLDCSLTLGFEGEFVVQAIFTTCQGFCAEPAPPGVTVNLNAIYGTAPDNVVAVGDAGTIIKWDGQKWAPETSGVAVALHGVAVPRNGLTFYAVGDAGMILGQIYTQSDWKNLTPSGFSKSLYAVGGARESEVFAVGAAGGYLRGNISDGFVVKSPTDVRADQQLNCLSVNSDTSSDAHTVGGDGGFTLRRTRLLTGGDYFSDPAKGTSENLYGIFYAGSQIYAVGQNGTIFRRTSGFGGYSDWVQMTSPTTTTLRAIWGSAQNNIYAVGDGGTVLVFDGTSWQKQTNISTNKNLYGIWGTGANNIYVVGEGGTILHRLP